MLSRVWLELCLEDLDTRLRGLEKFLANGEPLKLFKKGINVNRFVF